MTVLHLASTTYWFWSWSTYLFFPAVAHHSGCRFSETAGKETLNWTHLMDPKYASWNIYSELLLNRWRLMKFNNKISASRKTLSEKYIFCNYSLVRNSVRSPASTVQLTAPIFPASSETPSFHLSLGQRLWPRRFAFLVNSCLTLRRYRVQSYIYVSRRYPFAQHHIFFAKCFFQILGFICFC